MCGGMVHPWYNAGGDMPASAATPPALWSRFAWVRRGIALRRRLRAGGVWARRSGSLSAGGGVHQSRRGHPIIVYGIGRRSGALYTAQYKYSFLSGSCAEDEQAACRPF